MNRQNSIVYNEAITVMPEKALNHCNMLTQAAFEMSMDDAECELDDYYKKV